MTQVIRTGGSMGQFKVVLATFTNHEEAKAYAARMRSYLTPGEKSYYGIKYLTKKLY